ncbi:MAG: hypothetical protein SFU98_16175 [Leptospiraceae bacterium]|nr:hypothetical protein [Leptospiraceae bacterium]
MKKIFVFLMIVFSLTLVNCKKEENSIDELNRLLKEEKLEAAKNKLKTKLAKKHETDEILSNATPKLKRELSMSNDRNRIVWTEDNNVYFRDLANPLTKKLVFPSPPVNISVSYDAEYAIIYFPLPNGAGCKMLSVPLIENKQSFVSNSFVSCDTDGGISHDGTYIYYFLGDDLYQEITSENGNLKVLIDKKFFDKQFSNIRNRYHFYPIGKTFLIFSGAGGAYTLYWFNPKQNVVEKLATDVASSKLHYGNYKDAYFISGTIGNLYLNEVKFSTVGKPTIHQLVSITHKEAKSFPTSTKGEFIANDSGNIFVWGNGKPKKNLPILTESFWVVARNGIIFEDDKKELILSSMSFTEEDWEYLNLYKKVDEESKKNDE